MIIAVDFDDCLCLSGKINKQLLTIIVAFSFCGDEIHIMTARNKKYEYPEYRDKYMDPGYNILVADFVKEHRIPIEEIHFTNHELKGPFLKKIGAERHFDDNHEHLHSAHDHGIEAYHVDWHLVTKYEPSKPFDCNVSNCIVCSGDY